MGIVAIFLLVTIGIVGVLVYRFDHILWMDKMSSLESDERSQASALAQSVSGDLRILSETFSLMAKEIRQVGSEYSPVSALGAAFCKDGRCAQMLTILRFNSEGVWSFEKTSYLEKSPANGWAENYLALIIKDQSHIAETKVGDVFVFPMQSPDRQTFLMTISPQTVNGLVVWFGALYPSDFFQSLVDINKGNSSQVLMVTSSGYALAHSLPEYIGQNFENDPIVKELMHTGSFSGSGVFSDNGANPKHGVYEQVPHSNLYFAVSTPMQNILHSRSEKRIELGLLGLAIASIGFGILLYVNPMRSRYEESLPQAGVKSLPPLHPATHQATEPPPAPINTSATTNDADEAPENSFVMQSPAPLPDTVTAYQYSDPDNSYKPRERAEEKRPQTFAEEEEDDDEESFVQEKPRRPVIHMNESELDAVLDGEDLLEKRAPPARRPNAPPSAPRAESIPSEDTVLDFPMTKSAEAPKFRGADRPSEFSSDKFAGGAVEKFADKSIESPAEKPAPPNVYDRPQFQLEKKSSKLDEIGFQIRKPGAKV